MRPELGDECFQNNSLLQPTLTQAIFSGDIQEVKQLLDNAKLYKQDVNDLGNCSQSFANVHSLNSVIPDAEKRSALHAAAFKCDPQLVSLLLNYGARVNAKDSKWLTPLHRACHVGSEVIEL